MQQILEPIDRIVQGRLAETHVTRRKLYTRPEVCALLRISRQTFRRRAAAWPWIQECLPRVGRPRFLAAPIDRYVSGRWPNHVPIVRPEGSRAKVQTLSVQ